MSDQKKCVFFKNTLFFIFIFLTANSFSQANADLSNSVWEKEEEIEHLGITLAYPLQRHEKEINLVTQFWRYKNSGKHSRDYSIRAEFEYGLTDRLMVEFEYSYLFLNPDRGVKIRHSGEMEFEAKYMYFSRAGLSSAIIASLGSNYELKETKPEREIEWGLAIPVGYEISKSFRSHLAYEMEYIEEQKPEQSLFAAMEYKPSGSFFIAQIGYSLIKEGDIPSRSNIIFGVSVPFDDLKIGLGIPIGLNEEAEDWGIAVNIEYEFEK